MNRLNRLCGVFVAGFLAICTQPSLADSPAGSATGFTVIDGSARDENGLPVPKAVSTQTLGSRATVTSSATLYGGFEMRAAGLVYMLIRGNSLGTLGVTQAYLDAPRVRVYNSLGQDIAVDNVGNTGFNFCQASNVFSAPVRSYYTTVRGQPPVDRDACNSGTLDAGVYTFSVTPSIVGVTTIFGGASSVPGSGEVLFEITLGPP